MRKDKGMEEKFCQLIFVWEWSCPQTVTHSSLQIPTHSRGWKTQKGFHSGLMGFRKMREKAKGK